MTGNITFLTILFVIVLIVPGVIFKRFYYQGPFVNQFGFGNFADRIITTLWLGLVVQIIAFLILGSTFKGKFLESKESIEIIYTELRNFNIPYISTELFKNTLIYFLFSILLSAGLGHFCHMVIRIFRLDTKNSVWRFSNDWHYYFTAEDRNIQDYDKDRKFDKTFISTYVTLEVEEGKDQVNKLSGIVASHKIGPDGNLNFIFLKGARKYSEDLNGKEIMKPIPGECHIVPFEQVKSMNLSYIYSTVKNRSIEYNEKVINILKVIWFLSLPFLVILPWWTDNSIGSKVIVIFLGFVVWILLSVILENKLIKNSKIHNQEIGVILFFVALFILVILFELKLLPQFLN